MGRKRDEHRRRPAPPAALARLGDDGQIMRAAFFGMLAATAAILFVDFRELTAIDADHRWHAGRSAHPARLRPRSPDAPAGPAGHHRPALLKQPLDVTLASGGVLTLTGTIDPGAAERFAAEIAARGEYVKTVALDSPGGSVADALAIGALIRAEGFTTSVAAGSLCASSCPLIFAAGKERRAAPVAPSACTRSMPRSQPGTLAERLAAAGNAMSDAQKTDRRDHPLPRRHGRRPGVWLHALETPPEKLYYFRE